MPAVVQDAGIIRAARSAIDVLLKFKGVSIVLYRKGTATKFDDGGHDFAQPYPLIAQKFAVTQLGGDILEDGNDGDTPVVKRNYQLTGKFDADVRIDDTWEDAEADYRVESVNDSSGYRTTATVVGFVKVPD